MEIGLFKIDETMVVGDAKVAAHINKLDARIASLDAARQLAESRQRVADENANDMRISAIKAEAERDSALASIAAGGAAPRIAALESALGALVAAVEVYRLSVGTSARSMAWNEVANAQDAAKGLLP